MTEIDAKYQKLKRLDTLDEDDFISGLNIEKYTKSKKNPTQKMMENWKAGITVGLVNLPLCVSLAVASGSTPACGIMSGIIAGIVSSIAGGSNFNIVGPTGALSGFLLNIVARYGVSALPYIAFTTGILTLIVKFYHLERYIDLCPTAVNEGFTLGVAFIIFFNQMNSALGIGKIKKEEQPYEMHTAGPQEEETLIHQIIENLKHIDQMKGEAFLIYLIFFFGLYILLKNYPTIPWMIVAAIVGIILGPLVPTIDTLKTKFGIIHFVIFDFSYLKESDPSILFDPRIWIDSLPIAFVAILESLISAKIADSMTSTRFHKQNEVRGLAISNLICGILGGIPVTAALARTALNIKSGATHKYSAGISSGLMLILGGLFIGFFSYIPMAVVAAQVCIVAVRMVNVTELIHIYHHDKKNFSILLAVAIICILRDPVIGIVLGMLIYLIAFCENLTIPCVEMITTHEKNVVSQGGRDTVPVFSNIEHHMADIPPQEGDYLIYRIVGILTFMNMTEHVERLKAIAKKEEDKIIVISLRYMNYIDIDGLNALKVLVEKVSKDIPKSPNSSLNKIVITGISKSKLDKINNNEWVEKMKTQNALIVNEHSTVRRASKLTKF
jgi:MFS superfamily sulfate permease-like transporter